MIQDFFDRVIYSLGEFNNITLIALLVLFFVLFVISMVVKRD